jgi:hypothetical protein
MRSLLLYSSLLLLACAHVEPAEPGPFIFFGELHGTNEIEAYVTARVIDAAQRGPVHLGLELPIEDMPLLSKFLSGTNDDGLRESKRWREPPQFGVTSKAMFKLLSDLRAAKNRGLPIEIYFFDSPDLDQDHRDQALGAAINAERQKHRFDTDFVLAGNYHARKTAGAPWDPKARFAASWLDQDVVALDVHHEAGTAWLCFTPKDCGEKPLHANVGAPYPEYDGIFSVGALTASPPQF